jgi:hypothetical protein
VLLLGERTAVCSLVFQVLSPCASSPYHTPGQSGHLGIFLIALEEIYSCNLHCSKASQEKMIRRLRVPQPHKHNGIRVYGGKAPLGEGRESTSNILAC